MKIHPVGAELLNADRRTDMTKLIVAFTILRVRLKSLINLLLRHFTAFYQKQRAFYSFSVDAFLSCYV